MSPGSGEIRSVARIVESIRTREGEGFLVHRPFPTPTLEDYRQGRMGRISAERRA